MRVGLEASGSYAASDDVDLGFTIALQGRFLLNDPTLNSSVHTGPVYYEQESDEIDDVSFMPRVSFDLTYHNAKFSLGYYGDLGDDFTAHSFILEGSYAF